MRFPVSGARARYSRLPRGVLMPRALLGWDRLFWKIVPMAAKKRRASLTVHVLRVTIAAEHEGRCHAKRSG